MKGAFLQIEMEGPPVFIQCNKQLTAFMVKFILELQELVTKEGILYCRVLKALNGCIQVSKLWYNKLTRVLQEEEYEHSSTNPCVMWQVVDGMLFLLFIYIDDIFLFS